MVTITNVTKQYESSYGAGRKWLRHKSAEKALDQVNLTLSQGEFLYVVGGSGAGKSSLLRLLATEEAPTSGQVALFGYNISRISPGLLRSIRRRVGYIPQDVRLIPDLTLAENVQLSFQLSGKKTPSSLVRKKVLTTLEQVGLHRKADQLCGNLSGGEAQRVAVARALVRDPEIIVADEPTGAQDQQYVWVMMDLFVQAQRRGTTVVLATHEREIVRRVRKKCAILKGGQLSIEDGVCIF